MSAADFTPEDLAELEALRARLVLLKRLHDRLLREGPLALTQDEIAAKDGTTRHEVREIERRATLKARHRAMQLLTDHQP